MQYVNPGIIGQYQQQAPGMVQSLSDGLKLKDAMQQSQQKQRDYQKQQAFGQALDAAAKAIDFTKPEGQIAIVQKLASQGFGQEAIHLAQAFPKAEIETKVPFDAGAAGVGTFGTKSGTFTPLTQPSQDPAAAPQPVISGATQKATAASKVEAAKAKFEADKFERQQKETERNNRAQNEIARKNAERAAAKDAENNATGIQIPGLTPQPGVQITKESVKAVKIGAQAYDTVKDQIKRLRNLYAQTGTEIGGEKARKLASMVRQIQLTLKGPEFLQLGVLAGPDMALLDEMVPNPTGFMDNMKAMTPGLGDPITPKLDELDNFIDSRYQSALNRNGFQKAEVNQPSTSIMKVGEARQFDGGVPSATSKPKADPLGLF